MDYVNKFKAHNCAVCTCTFEAISVINVIMNALLKSDVTRRDHVSVVMDAGSRIVNFIVNFIRDGTVFA